MTKISLLPPLTGPLTGSENVPLVSSNETMRSSTQLLADLVASQLPSSQIIKGDTGPANSTFTTLEALKAAPITNKSYTIVGTAIDGSFSWRAGDYSGTPVDDIDVNVIKQNDTDLSVGAIVRTGHDLDTPVSVDPSLPNPVVLRKILLDAQVSRILSASGVGDTSEPARIAETAKFQALCDTGRSFSVPAPQDAYAVKTIRLADGQKIEGAGEFSHPISVANALRDTHFHFISSDPAPIFLLGDGTGLERRQSLIGVSAKNVGGPCVVMDNAPNWLLERSRFFSSGDTPAVKANLSYRAGVKGCFIAAGGPGAGSNTWALDLNNNINGCLIDGNTLTGGSGGGAARIGQSYDVALTHNIVESSLHGFWVASDNNLGAGVVNSLFANDNNFEQCSTPWKVGTVFAANAPVILGGFISNAQTYSVTARTACMQLGRIRGGLIKGMNFHPHPTEDLFWLWLNLPTTETHDLEMGAHFAHAAPNAVYALKGAYAANASVKAAVGGSCNFPFMGGGDPQGTNHIREFITPLLDASVDSGTQAWIPSAIKALGGEIYSAQVIDYDGGTFGTAAISAGRSAALNETFNTALSALSFTNGVADIPISGPALLPGSDSIYRNLKDAAATAQYRMKFRYRIN
ncbi:hypothetical protein AB1K62_00535 [Parasphingorhabdus sp. JC815]|uniref:hypothetical protein n=1 Tax=Parasphingorhabdus sp. JC815 TaxID=3232140 RepID=UPI003458BC36